MNGNPLAAQTASAGDGNMITSMPDGDKRPSSGTDGGLGGGGGGGGGSGGLLVPPPPGAGGTVVPDPLLGGHGGGPPHGMDGVDDDFGASLDAMFASGTSPGGTGVGGMAGGGPSHHGSSDPLDASNS
ncbi:hypothetical protein THAOC_36297, partial [Thalassiosira oceanica]